MPFCTKAFNCHLVICNNFQSNYLMLGPCTCDQCTVCWQLLQCVQSGGIIPNPRMCQHATERKSLTGIMHKKLWKKSSRQGLQEEHFALGFTTLNQKQLFEKSLCPSHRAVTSFVTCSLILHTHNKFATLWVNSIDNRQFHLQHQEKINHMKPQQVLQVTDLNDSPVPFMLATKEILFPCCTFQ